jgi:DNA-binding protein Fis
VRTSLILGVGEMLSLADVSWLFDELQPLPQENDITFVKQSQNGESAHSRPCFRQEDAGKVSELGGIPLEQIERQAILDTLRQTAGNQTKAAKVLGISDRTLRDKIHRYRRQGCLQTIR